MNPAVESSRVAPRRRSLLLHPLVAVVVLALVSFGRASSSVSVTFQPSDRWSVIGDSITHHGTYYTWIYLYELTRFPTQKLTVENCGISGDSAAGAVQRYDWDIQPTHPTVATVMLGMNDVDRDAYSDQAATPEILRRREGALTTYRQSLEALVARLQKDHARVLLVTPSPFDEYLIGANQPDHPGVSVALAQCARIMRDLAATKSTGLVDLQEPMLALNAQLQAADPKATVIGPDRVHPGPAGHFLMAYFFLRAQGAPTTVARIKIDAARSLVACDRAKITDLAASEDRVEFNALEDALPYPVPDDAKPALDWVPFQDELNQEMLQVSGLKPGVYSLAIDGEPVGVFSAEVLGAGINLAALSSTPQLRQAREVVAVILRWQELVAHSQRTLAEVEHWRLRGRAHPVQLGEVKPYLVSEYDRLLHSDEPNRKWDCLNIQRYLVLKPQQAALQDELAALQARLRAAATPQDHHFQIAPKLPF